MILDKSFMSAPTWKQFRTLEPRCSKGSLQTSCKVPPGSVRQMRNLRPHPTLTQSESAFEQDPQVIHSTFKLKAPCNQPAKKERLLGERPRSPFSYVAIIMAIGWDVRSMIPGMYSFTRQAFMSTCYVPTTVLLTGNRKFKKNQSCSPISHPCLTYSQPDFPLVSST